VTSPSSAGPEEIDHGLEILSGLKGKTHYVMGAHDYYLDLGEYWRKQLGPDHYRFDNKRVLFVVMNSILTFDEWAHRDWENGMARMKQMARLDNPHGSPFMVGEAQRNWLKGNVAKVPKDKPVVVMSHSPPAEKLQTVEFLDRGFRAGAGTAETLRQGDGAVWSCPPDRVQTDRQHQLPLRHGDRPGR
jgi:predicted phosphohydrolase